MRIGFDIDNVFYPFYETMHAYAENALGRTLQNPGIWKNYEGWGISDATFVRMMEEGHDEGWVYWRGAPLEAPIDTNYAINELRKTLDDVQVVLITNRPEYARHATQWWVGVWGLTYDELVITDDKTQWGLDWLIDDAPHNVLSAREAGIRAVTFNRPWNTHVPGERSYTITGFCSKVITESTVSF